MQTLSQNQLNLISGGVTLWYESSMPGIAFLAVAPNEAFSYFPDAMKNEVFYNFYSGEAHSHVGIVDVPCEFDSISGNFIYEIPASWFN